MNAPASHEATLLNADFLSRLDRVDVLSRKILAGKLAGVKQSRRSAPAAALQHVDYRPYSPGDDPRFVDWNIYARLDRLMVKLFAQDEEFFVHLLIDVSSSCDFGTPAKSLYARQLAAALAYVGLVNHHHVSLHAIADGTAISQRPLRGRANLPGLMRFLSTLKSHGASRFAAECDRFTATAKTAGICIVLSDFLFDDGLEKGLDLLRAAGNELYCIQILSPQELAPSISGTDTQWELVDLEHRRTANFAPTPTLLHQYQNNLNAHCRRVRQAIQSRGACYIAANTQEPFDRLVLDHLRRHGLLG